MSYLFHLILPDLELFPCCNLNLFLDDIDAGNHLRYGVFNLKPRVHLQKVEVPVLVHEKLHCSRTFILDRFRRLDCNFAHFVPDLIVDKNRWALFYDLLMSPLYRTFPLEEMNGVAELIGQNLNLDVAGLFYVFFDIHGIITE